MEDVNAFSEGMEDVKGVWGLFGAWITEHDGTQDVEAS